MTQERTLKRKIQEVFLAIQLEKQYTKQEILELYLNQIYFGQGAYGVQAAAKTYFGKNIEELNLSECAMLAGIPKSPNYYSPFNNKRAAIERRNTVLEQMQKYNYIRASEAAEAKNFEIVLAQPNQPEEQKDAAYFLNYVTQLVIDKYGADALYKEGLKIYTTIDMDVQRMAETSLLEILPTYETDSNGLAQPQGALVAIDPKTGYIKAMVGGRGTDQFNRATMAERQPGSAFKPFVFAAALENNFTPDTIIEDSPVNINGWRPQNDNGTFRGSVTLRQVATNSMNVPTVKIAQALGMDKPIFYAQEMGITTFILDGEPNDKNFATSLGGMTKGVTPLEIASAYCTFANDGVYMPHIAITKILDRNGRILEEVTPEGKAVISQQSAASLTSMLEDVISRGTGKNANIGRPAAGKTGTTSNYKDAWFVGYTPDLVAAVWIGNDDNSNLPGIMGGGIPATIWSSFMKKALANVPVHDFNPMVVNQRGSGRAILRDAGNGESEENKNSREQGQSTESEPPRRDQQSRQPEVYEPEENYSPPSRQDYFEPAQNENTESYSPPEPEPQYNDTAPTENYDAPSYDDAPSRGGGVEKGI